MMESPSWPASSASASPTRTLRSSDSTTHGPAMRNGLLSEPNRVAMSVRQLGQLARRFGARVQFGVVDRGADESGEQRMRAHGPRLELRMELAADEPGMLRELDHLDERAVGGEPGGAQPELRQDVAIRVRDLVAVGRASCRERG